MLLGDIIRQNAMKFPDKTAVICGDTRLTYLELDSQVNRVANALLGLGVKRGGRVAVLADGCLPYMEVYFAAAKGGMITVPINTALSSQEVSYTINDSGANTIIFGENYSESINSMRSELKTVKNYIVIGKMPGAESYQEIVSGYSSDEPEVTVDEDDVAWLGYTSGTTGAPKGVMLSHKNVISDSKDMIISGYPISRDDINLCLVPMSHVSGMLQQLLYCLVGATNVVLEKYDPKLVLDIIERERVTAGILATPMLVPIVNYPDIHKYNVSSLRLLIVGGAPMPEGLAAEVKDIFGDITLPGYGMVEASAFITVTPLLEGPLQKVKRAGSCGKELVNVEIKLVNDEDEDVAVGEVGEILVAGDNVMKGYWNKPEETARALEGGYLHTGDLATKDKEGYYYITERKKDTIITAGNQVYSPEIESVISLHPAVSEAAVVGVPHKELGELVKAIVALKKGREATEQDIIEWCSSRLEGYKVPKSIDFINSLPKTASGKVRKTILRDRYSQD